MSVNSRKITSLVRHCPRVNPRLIGLLKNTYLYVCRCLGTLFFWLMKGPIDLEVIGSEGSESFKGYYDIPPENEQGLIFVYECDDNTTQKPRNLKQITIAIYESSNLANPIATQKTQAFNWQQGSRAYWLDDQRLIFNDYCPATDKYIAKIWNVVYDFIEKEIGFAVEARFDKTTYLSINFKRLTALRPDYGYFAHLHQDYIPADNDNDGIWIVDIDSGEGRLVYSLTEIIASSTDGFCDATEHKLNHLMVSPDSKRCLVIHRYFIDGARRGRLLIVHLEEKKIIEIPTGGIVSHYSWLDSNLAVGYLNSIEGCLKYFYIDVDSASLKESTKLNCLHYGDGHPTAVGNGGFVTDTYPNRWGIQKLVYFDGNGVIHYLLELAHGVKYTRESRCDLHPVFCGHSGYLYLDSVFSGKRRLYRRKATF